MNKELIKRQKKEFDHFLNNGSVLCTDWENTNTKWRETKSCGNDFTYTGSNPPIFVINDEYVEFRKAIAEGKELESQVKHGHGSQSYPAEGTELKDCHWKQDSTGIFVGEARLYRIKPTKPKFKIGDWVMMNWNHGDGDTPIELLFEKEGEFYWDKLCEQPISEDGTLSCLWKPKLGDLCWFWNDDMERYPDLRRYFKEDNHVCPYLTMPSGRYKYIEPLLGNLPTHMREKK